MSLLKRFAFYFGGFALGLVFLFFIKDKIGASFEFDYGPNARTLKNIRIKKRQFSNSSLQFLKEQQLDTAAISYILKNGDVIFSESNTKLDSCKIYVIEGNVAPKKTINADKKIKITVENCEKKATINSIISIE